MRDPIKNIIKTPKFNIFVWGDLIISYKDKMLVFRDREDLVETNIAIQALIEYLEIGNVNEN